MKSLTDPRHIKRQKLVQELFAWQAQKHLGQETAPAFIAPIIGNLPSIDKQIEFHAQKWPKEMINMVDLAILRLAVYELEHDRQAPLKVVIDEAIELAKEYGGDSSPAFVNGVLSGISQEQTHD